VLVALSVVAALTLTCCAQTVPTDSQPQSAILTYSVREASALAVNPVSGVVYASVGSCRVCADASSTAATPAAQLGCVELTHADYGNVAGSMAVSLDGLTLVHCSYVCSSHNWL
jgi:hypothetical protein